MNNTLFKENINKIIPLINNDFKQNNLKFEINSDFFIDFHEKKVKMYSDNIEENEKIKSTLNFYKYLIKKENLEKFIEIYEYLLKNKP
jgi:hypothetical protein